MKKTKMEKGITLIALIITIVILLILAVVAITSIQSEGIFAHAENAANKWNKSVEEEQGTIGKYEEILDNIDKGNNDDDSDMTVAKVKNKVITSNTEVKDEYGNKIVVPAGFMIRVDETTNNADTVTKGIVIEDCTYTETKGSQFVWIPVGIINTNTEGTESKEITLGRYSNFTATDGVYTPAQKAEDYAKEIFINSYYTEDTESNHNSKDNSIARNIEEFITSATTKGGYYIGRYEAGDSNSNDISDRTSSTEGGTLVCKANQVPYNYITQQDASIKCQSMYGDGYGTGTFSSDLINSYAWDTAIIFIQTFGKTDYASTVGKSSISDSTPQKTGTNRLSITNGSIDEQLNIYDMAGNCCEWSTETYRDDYGDGVQRGGVTGNTRMTADFRKVNECDETSHLEAFRPLLYVGL